MYELAYDKDVTPGLSINPTGWFNIQRTPVFIFEFSQHILKFGQYNYFFKDKYFLCRRPTVGSGYIF